MRLIDADALPHSWQPDCNGNRWFVAGRDIDAAPTISCEACTFTRTDPYEHDRWCCDCHCGSNFDRRQP